VISALSGGDVELLLRAAFLIGAVTDGLAIVPMLSPRAASALFGGDPGRASREYRYAMLIGASLMAGWTVLLLWGAASPFERRDLLVLTVVPVVAGIVAASVVASRRGVVKAARMVPLWIHLSLISALYLVAYGLSAPLVP
jgi:undecaprenyl pyrophosphate phosphatase UppP